MEHASTAAWVEAGAWLGPCAAATEQHDQAVTNLDRASWDLDVGDAASWMRATRICVEECPFAAECRRLLQSSYPGKARPSGVIWAGVAYNEIGKPLNAEGLRRLSAVRRNQRCEPRRSPAACC